MDTHPTPFEALSMAVDIAGSQSAFARMLGVSQPTVWKWLQSTKRLPAEYVLPAERGTGVSRHLLRPDIYPRDLPPFDAHSMGVSTGGGKGPCDRPDKLHGAHHRRHAA